MINLFMSFLSYYDMFLGLNEQYFHKDIQFPFKNQLHISNQKTNLFLKDRLGFSTVKENKANIFTLKSV